MTEKEINKLIRLYPIDKDITPDTAPWASQYDQRSASINYALVRHFKPKVVVEFGAKGGRCTRDITRALLDNSGKFVMKSYELEDGSRMAANNNLKTEFGELAPVVGDDIMKADDIPTNIDYLFIDNNHDEKTTKWVFDTLIPGHCRPNCLVQFHDMVEFRGTMEELSKQHPNSEQEIGVILELFRKGKFPLEKLYWTPEENQGRSSTWWIYKK